MSATSCMATAYGTIWCPLQKAKGFSLTRLEFGTAFHFSTPDNMATPPCSSLARPAVLDPRLLVQAQQEAAKRQGCDIIDDVVEVVGEWKHSDGEPIMRLLTKRGRAL